MFKFPDNLESGIGNRESDSISGPGDESRGQAEPGSPRRDGPARGVVPRLEGRGLARRGSDGRGWLLEDVSIAVRPGERVALVGPSGSGKTLLLRALAMLDPVDRGQVLWDGHPVRPEAIPAFRSRVIYLHQRPPLFEGTVEDNLRLPFDLRAHRAGRFDRGRALGLLESLGRDAAFLGRSHRDLSGGEGQIVAVVRALQLDASVLLLDEPTAALDGPTAGALEAVLGRWFVEGDGARSLVWITHDPAQAGRVGDRRIALSGGRLDGSVA